MKLRKRKPKEYFVISTPWRSRVERDGYILKMGEVVVGDKNWLAEAYKQAEDLNAVAEVMNT